LSLPETELTLWHSTTVDQLRAVTTYADESRIGIRAATTAMIISGAMLMNSCGQIPPAAQAPSPSPVAISPAPTGSPTPIPAGTRDICEYSISGTAARHVAPPPTAGVPTSGKISYVLAMTNGDVKITLDWAKAPCTVNSFVSLADQGFFNDTKCHRLADSGIFILQCGDPTGTGKGGPGYEFADETDGTESYTEGTLAMANGGPGSNGSQFFLVWADSTSLDKKRNFTIFGGMDKASRDVVASMAEEGQDGSNADGTGRPNNPSEIVSVARA
jgi:cyclophilin family peptidyl-prolyl cis-trans isomerase